MSKPRPEILARLRVVRGMPAPEASAYLGLGESKFQQMVADGRMPKPRVADGKRLWDVEELDSAFRNLPRELDDTPGISPYRVESNAPLLGSRKSKPDPSPTAERHAYSVKLLALRWGCSTTHIHTLIRNGQLHSFRFGKLIRISAAEVARMETLGGAD